MRNRDSELATFASPTSPTSPVDSDQRAQTSPQLPAQNEDLQTSAGPPQSPAPKLEILRLALMVVIVSLVSALLVWPLPFLLNTTQTAALNHLVSTKHLDLDVPILPDAVVLLLCVLAQTACTGLVLAQPLPLGSVTPTFVIGALLGRAVGVALTPFFSSVGLHEENEHVVATFALVGACAFCSGVVRSFAQVVLVFERVGVTELLLPLCASSLCAVLVANRLALSFFDSLIWAKHLPYLPSLTHGRHEMTAMDVMTDQIPVLPPVVSAHDLQRVSAKYSQWDSEVPIVSSVTSSESAGNWTSQTNDAVLLSALAGMPSIQEGAEHDLLKHEDLVVPLQVPGHTTVKQLLPLLTLQEKSTAFVTHQGMLVGAVTLSDLYLKASHT